MIKYKRYPTNIATAWFLLPETGDCANKGLGVRWVATVAPFRHTNLTT